MFFRWLLVFFKKLISEKIGKPFRNKFLWSGLPDLQKTLTKRMTRRIVPKKRISHERCQNISGKKVPMEQPFQLVCYFYVPIRDVTSNHNNPEFNRIFRVDKLVARTFIANPK